MVKQESKADILKETFPSEIVSIVMNIAVGLVLAVLILPFESFAQIIIMVPALLSVRGNISGSFVARTARDLIIGTFKKTMAQNVLAVVVLTGVTGCFIAALSMIFATLLHGSYTMPVGFFFAIPLLTMALTELVSIPVALLMNMAVFKRGMNPCNVVPPVMTSIDDVLISLFFFAVLVMLGVS